MRAGKAHGDNISATRRRGAGKTGAFRRKLFSSSRRFFCFQANSSPAMGKGRHFEGRKVRRPPDLVKNRRPQPVERGKVELRENLVPQDTIVKPNRLENTKSLIRRAAKTSPKSHQL